MSHRCYFTSSVVVGRTVTGYSTGPGYRTTFAGVYDGARPSEWDGEPHHHFRDGIIGDTPQGVFTFPVAQFNHAADRDWKVVMKTDDTVMVACGCTCGRDDCWWNITSYAPSWVNVNPDVGD